MGYYKHSSKFFFGVDNMKQEEYEDIDKKILTDNCHHLRICDVEDIMTDYYNKDGETFVRIGVPLISRSLRFHKEDGTRVFKKDIYKKMKDKGVNPKDMYIFQTVTLEEWKDVIIKMLEISMLNKKHIVRVG